MATIKEIAAKAGVSPATVSNVLHNRKNVSAEVREHILSLCREMNYPVRSSKKCGQTLSTRTVLFIFSEFERPFYIDIIRGIQDYLQKQNYHFIICSAQTCAAFMTPEFTCGAIVLDSQLADETIRRYACRQYPVVSLDRFLDQPNLYSVLLNNYNAMCHLISGLIDRGYKKFAYVGGPEHTQDHIERYQGFLDTLKKHQLPFSSSDYYPGDYFEKSGYQAARLLMLTPPIPEILICANDLMAIGALKAFKEENFFSRRSIAVTGFDNIELSQKFGVTTIGIPNYERGVLAAKTLLSVLEKKEVPPLTQVNGTVHWRHSTPRL